MRVKVGPHELPAHILEAKFKMRVLINGVVPAEIRARANGHALLFGYFIGTDQPRRIARARRCHGGIEGMVKGIAQRYARSAMFQSAIQRNLADNLVREIIAWPSSPHCTPGAKFTAEKDRRKNPSSLQQHDSSLTQLIRLTRNS